MLADFIEVNGLKAEIIPVEKERVHVVSAIEKINGVELFVVKSILFMDSTEEPVLCVLLGKDKVSLKKLKKILAVKDVRIASPKEVLQVTGYEVGGVPPISIFGVKTIIDPKVLKREKIVCGGGNSFHLLKIQTLEIQEFAFEPSVEEITE